MIIMKIFLHRFPFLSRIVLAVALGAFALFLNGAVYSVVPIREFFPFAGVVFLLLFTWLLYRTEKDVLPPLGLHLSVRNMVYLFGGLTIGVIALAGTTWLRTLYTGEGWQLSSAVDANVLAKSLYFILPSVMVEELLFRGYLFTKTVSRYGLLRANILFAIAFMLVHVLDRNVLQNPAQVIFLAITIPVGHLWFSTALVRSKTMLFPIGLHWGNNWAVQHLAGANDNTSSIFHLTNQQVVNTWPPFIFLLLIFNGFFLLVILLTWRWKLPAAFRTAAQQRWF